jgi:hypothetical protein
MSSVGDDLATLAKDGKAFDTVSSVVDAVAAHLGTRVLDAQPGHVHLGVDCRLAECF